MDTNNQISAQELLEFLNKSPTAFHAVDESAKILKSAGFTELRENQKWELKKEGKYFLKRNNSSLIAFEIGSDLSQNGFRIIGTHTDSPCFKLKPGNAIVTSDGYVKLNTECYGGVILSTWFDRPLSLAGRVISKSQNGRVETLINSEKPVLIIPSLCIHFNREVSEGYTFNKQIEMLPFLGFADNKTPKSDYLFDIIYDSAGISGNKILDYDLFLYESDKGRLMGLNEEFISASRLDNLWMVFTSVQAMIKSGGCTFTKILAAFDNEEIGSATMSGANSLFLYSVLQRICSVLNLTVEETQIAISNSLAVSADCAHAVHPNYSDKHDQTNRPVLGKGLAIKYSAGQKYGTNASTAAAFIEMCENYTIPYQKFVNRSDIAGGSSLGPSMSSLTSVPTVDVGIPVLAMHSIRELGCIYDNKFAIDALSKFFSY